MPAGIITTQTHPSIYVESLYSCAIDKFNTAPKQADAIGKVVKQSKGPTVQMKSLGTMGLLPTKGEGQAKALLSFEEQHLYELTAVVKAGAVVITEEAIKDDRYDIITQAGRLLGDAAGHTREQYMLNAWFNNAFDVTKTDDGVYVYSASHTWKNGGAVFSNLGAASAFSIETLWTAINAMRNQKNDQGIPMDMKPTHLYYPIELTQLVTEVFDSQYFPDDDRNAVNAITKFNITPVCVPGLTSSTAWFLANKQNHTMFRWDVWPQSFGHDGDFMTDNSLFSAKSRYAAGVQRPIGLYGSVGA